MNRKQVFEFNEVKHEEGELRVIGRAYEPIAVGDVLLACPSEEATAACAVFKILKINFATIEVESLGSGYVARLTLIGQDEATLRKSKHLFADTLSES